MNQLSRSSVALVLCRSVWQKPGDFHWPLHLLYSLKLGLSANTTYLEELIPLIVLSHSTLILITGYNDTMTCFNHLFTVSLPSPHLLVSLPNSPQPDYV